MATVCVTPVERGEDSVERADCGERIAERNPRAVVVSLTAFGSTGPLADRSGNGTIAEAFSGFAHLNGAIDGPPTLPSLALGDSLAAVSALNAVLAALYWRDANGGRGQFIDASIFEPLLHILSSSLAAWDGTTPPPARNGSRIANAAPRNVYVTADRRWIAISGPTDPQVSRVLDLIGGTQGATRAKFGSAQQRTGDVADELDQIVALWVASMTLSEIETALINANIPHSAVNSFTEVVHHSHVVARNSLVPLPGAKGRLMAAPIAPMSQSPAAHRANAPSIGEHTNDVLRDWLGH